MTGNGSNGGGQWPKSPLSPAQVHSAAGGGRLTAIAWGCLVLEHAIAAFLAYLDAPAVLGLSLPLLPLGAALICGVRAFDAGRRSGRWRPVVLGGAAATVAAVLCAAMIYGLIRAIL